MEDDSKPISELKNYIEEFYGGDSHNDSRSGVLTWIGEPNAEGVNCSFWEATSHKNRVSLRFERLSSMHAAVDRRARVQARKKGKAT